MGSSGSLVLSGHRHDDGISPYSVGRSYIGSRDVGCWTVGRHHGDWLAKMHPDVRTPSTVVQEGSRAGHLSEDGR